jgi:hypothetical protein
MSTRPGRDQNVAAISKALTQRQYLRESRGECRGQLPGLVAPAGRAGPQHQCGLAEYERGILDEDRIRKRLERLEHGDVDTGAT